MAHATTHQYCNNQTITTHITHIHTHPHYTTKSHQTPLKPLKNTATNPLKPFTPHQ